MRKFFVILFITMIVFSSVCLVQQVSSEANDSPQGDHVIVYYFHGDIRCANCHKIETYTKEAVDEYFSKEINSGELLFKAVNVDRSQNQHFVKDYQLYTKSVVVSMVENGKEVKYENLQGVWNYLGDRQRFLDYIRTEVDKYLKELG